MDLQGTSLLALATAGTGGLVLYSGVTGAGFLSNARNLMSGDRPSSADVSPIPQTTGQTTSAQTSAAAANGITGGQGSAGGMVQVAASQLGVGDVGAKYHNKFTEWYGIGDAEWCDIFVSWCANQNTSLAACGGKQALTTTHAAWFMLRGQWHSGWAGILPGDIVFLNPDGGGTSIAAIGHVGIANASASNGCTTIAGDTGAPGGAVRVETWAASGYVVGYGRPAYPVTDTLGSL